MLWRNREGLKLESNLFDRTLMGLSLWGWHTLDWFKVTGRRVYNLWRGRWRKRRSKSHGRKVRGIARIRVSEYEPRFTQQIPPL